MENIYDTLAKLLRSDERFVSTEGDLLRNAVCETANNMDENLLHLLLSNNITREHFFRKVDDILIFDKILFGWVINNKEFLPDSYTRFKNKIGLADDNGNLLATSGNVELVFPYKDCILEGGQTKEDQKRSEVFYNEMFAPREIDRLLYPKTLVNAKCYAANVDDQGSISFTITKAKELQQSNNLIVRGNNLLVLSSIEKVFANKVQCIYIDPPYNTGSDSFGYNDAFNHSSWLTFMKNRLVIAKRLLKSSGILFISVDDHESAYIKVLCDEIFGRENFLSTIAYERSGVSGLGQGGSFLVNTHESIICFAKDKNVTNTEDLSGEYPFGYEEMKRYNKVLLSAGESEEIDRFEASATHEDVIIRKHANYSIQTISLKQFDSRRAEIEEQYLQNFDKIYRNTSVQAENEFQNKILDYCGDGLYSAEYTVSRGRNKGKKIIAYYYNKQVFAWLKDSADIVDSQIVKTNKLSDFWNHGSIPKADLANEGGVKLRRGKKPENLLKRLFSIATKEGDLILDFFLGSGTSVAVAHKMNRRYIGIEQLDYGDNDAITRLQHVICGEQSGISKKVNWKGGGSFVYCELAQLNQKYVDLIRNVNSDDQLLTIWNKMEKTGFISYKVKPSEIDAHIDDFKALSLDNKKKFLMEVLDKNMLYVNLCDIDDEEFCISDEDKAFNKSFYGEV
jgi:adenine-specific DNA-methyltransferase